MENSIEELGTKKTKSFFNKQIKNINLFTVFQVIWVIEVYYLMINSLLNLMRFLQTSTLYNILNEIPDKALEYNNLIIQYFDEWSFFAILLGIACFISGGIIGGIKYLPKIGDYTIIKVYADYGLYSGGWLLLIGSTYLLYNLNSKIFFLSFILMMIVVITLSKVIKDMREWLNDKGITI